jgi:hypothetical protein
MIAAETAIFPTVDIDLSFCISSPHQRGENKGLYQPFPKTDPGLAGDTGVSGDCGCVYESDGLNVGAGIGGASFTGGWNPWLMWPP